MAHRLLHCRWPNVDCLDLIAAEHGAVRQNTAPSMPYLTLLASLWPLVRRYPEILLSGSIQGLNFGIFISIWLGLGLHLTSPEMGYGVDTVGYLALLAVINLFTAPRLGVWADKTGARKARAIFAGIQLAGVSLFLVFGHSLWLLLIPIIITNMFGPVIDVSSRMTFLNEDRDVRTRLMTVFIVFMFVGAGVASWAGTSAYDTWGWTGNAVLALLASITVLCLCIFAHTNHQRSKNK